MKCGYQGHCLADDCRKANACMLSREQAKQESGTRSVWPRGPLPTVCPVCGPKDAKGPNGELLSHVTCGPCAVAQAAAWRAELEAMRAERERRRKGGAA